MLDWTKIDKTWTLFLDRDGVLNREKEQDYVRDITEFHFYDGVPDAVQVLSEVFGTIILVTNQKGIGKGLMTEADLAVIHRHMLDTLEAHGGRIDRIYFAPDLENDAFNRKPQPGMAYQAKIDFPQIDFSKSIMVGNKPTDMRFGRNAGMHTVFLATTNPETTFPHNDIDARFEHLPALARYLQQVKAIAAH